MSSRRCKHIDILHHFLCRIANGEIVCRISFWMVGLYARFCLLSYREFWNQDRVVPGKSSQCFASQLKLCRRMFPRLMALTSTRNFSWNYPIHFVRHLPQVEYVGWTTRTYIERSTLPVSVFVDKCRKKFNSPHSSDNLFRDPDPGKKLGQKIIAKLCEVIKYKIRPTFDYAKPS